MVPFKLTPEQKRILEKKFSRQHRVVQKSSKRMEDLMLAAAEEIISNWNETKRYKAPDLSGMAKVSEGFYYDLLTEAVRTCKEEGQKTDPRKRLAKDPLGLPRTLRSMAQIFRNKKYWPKIMKRSKMMTKRLRESYLKKLQTHFEKLMPQLLRGDLSPLEAKKKMVDAWQTSRSRVETIFRTETTTYFSKTQVAYFDSDPDIIGFLFDSIRDVSRTDICRSRHGLVYRPGTTLLTENCPACHYKCRSHLIALADTPENRLLLLDPRRDPSKVKVVPLMKGWRAA